MKKYIEPTLHLLFWIILVLLLFKTLGYKVRVLKLNDEVSYTLKYDFNLLYFFLIDVLFKALMFYSISFYFIPKLLYNKQTIYFIVCLLVIALFSMSLNYLSPVFINMNSGDISSVLDISYLIHFFILILAFGYRFAKDKYTDEQYKNQLIKEKLSTELKYLKAQVNPHFLFNTLNNIFSLARKHTDKRAAESIGQLSRLMRYMIYDSNVDNVLLEGEIKYLEDFIKLQKLRITSEDPISINFINTGKTEKVKIAPMILLPFVENAFKHGISLESDSKIDIKIESHNDILIFEVRNTIHEIMSAKKEETGFGLQNVKRRLELLYPGNYELNIDRSEGVFYTKLLLKTQG